MEIGFLGLGIMGRHMAGHLIEGGHKVVSAIHKTPAPPELLDKGLSVLDTPEDVARQAQIVITMVPDTPEVGEVLFGERGVAAGLSPGKTVVDMSSISPIATRDFAKQIGELGCDYLDAPVSGGDVGAKAGTLTIMVGGSDVAFRRVRPLFELMGKTVTHIGPNGDGQTAKVANQIIVALTIEAVAEGLLFASKAGADPVKVREALLGGFASSKILEIHGERMIKRAFEPGFRIDLHQKDLNNALSGARALGLSLPNTATAQELYNACVARGGAGWDASAMIRALEAMADHELG